MKLTEEAEKIINGARQKSYGDANISFTQIAKIWSGILNMEITPEEVSLCLIGLKLQRESHSHDKDNLLDIIGYVLLSEKLNERKNI